jgi:hypothetical protein
MCQCKGNGQETVFSKLIGPKFDFPPRSSAISRLRGKVAERTCRQEVKHLASRLNRAEM